jgi:hypothetical protein
MDAWTDQPYGCGEALQAKRVSRDPFSRGVPYMARCAALHAILEYCGPQPFPLPLPWAGPAEQRVSSVATELAIGALRLQN